MSPVPSSPLRLLFCSPHCYLDTSSGAALATRGLLALLAARGWPCAVYCGDRLDFEQPPPLGDLLQRQGLAAASQRVFANGTPFTLTDVVADGVPVSMVLCVLVRAVPCWKMGQRFGRERPKSGDPSSHG